ncbi:MAG: Cof-type HAD-IIB family hydrolase [Bacteroidales bacterium]|jgi:hypothetical protein|nr:Cof-type HAD-IIB family hydrolase [Bacteroidales bacterium]ODT57160.1 MAG: hydrolase [Paludibacter sp. SCN 50-10]OJX90849.1 MAG: hydrolase [Paludibacter sp. 47-17]
MIKALFLDIDGTLVSFDTHTITPSTIDALSRAKTRGVRIFIATGRPLAIINNLQPIEHLIDGYITANGAYCFTGNEEVLCKPIPRKDVERVIQLSDELAFSCIVVSKTEIMVHNADERFDSIFRKMLNVNTIQDDVPVAGFLNQPILQLTPLITPGQESSIMPQLPGCMSTRWHPAFTDITLTGIDKAAGIEAIAERLDITLSETMAIGDGGNDIAMLGRAGTGVAMGNASAEVQAAADYVTASVDDDGVRKALEKFGVVG